MITEIWLAPNSFPNNVCFVIFLIYFKSKIIKYLNIFCFLMQRQNQIIRLNRKLCIYTDIFKYLYP